MTSPGKATLLAPLAQTGGEREYKLSAALQEVPAECGEIRAASKNIVLISATLAAVRRLSVDPPEICDLGERISDPGEKLQTIATECRIGIIDRYALEETV